MKNAILKSVDLLNEEEFGDIEQLITEAISISLDKNLGTNYFHDPHLRLMQMQEVIDARSIGWNSIDELIDYIKRGELFLFAGESGSGKSVVLSNVANNLAKDGMNVLYISLELNEALVSKRIDSIITNITNKDIFDNVDEVVKRIEEVKDDYGSFYVKKMPIGTCANDIRTYLMEYRIEFGHSPDAIFVDYLDLMSPNAKVGTGVFEIDKAISEQTREVFVDFNAYGFSASQLNRDAEGVEIYTHRHIAGGKAKINTADVVMGIKRTEKHMDDGIIALQPMKLRNATLDKIFDFELDYNSKTLEITDKKTTKKAPKVKNKLTTKNKSSKMQTTKDKEANKEVLNRLQDVIKKSKST